jgi:iron(III) transport system permease protein
MNARRASLATWVVLATIVFFAVGPVLLLVGRSLISARVGLVEDVTSPAGLTAILNTLRVAFGASLLALLLATPLALLLYRTDLPGRRGLALLFTLPSAIPPFISAMGWISLANPKAGYLNRLLGEGTLNIYTLPGMVFVLGIAELPIVLLAGRAALARVDSTLEEAARMSGAGPLRALLSATLPLTWPALFAGAGLVFLSAASAFGVPYLLGVSSTPPAPVLTTRIYGWVLQGGQANLARAVGLSAVLLASATLMLVVSNLLSKRGRVRLLAGKGVASRPIRLGRARWPLFIVSGVVAGVTVLLPLAAVFLTSVQRSFGAELRWDQLTVKHWGAVLTNPRTLSAVSSSLTLAAAAGLLVCGLGLAVALVRHRGGRMGGLTDALASWPYAVPGTVLALALIVAFSRDLRFILFDRVAFVLTLGDSAWLLIVAYAARHLALGSRNLGEGLAQLDPSLAEAARLSGAGPVRAFRDALLPLLRPAFVTAFLLTFLACANELTMSVLLVPPGRELLGPLLFEMQSYADPSAASVLASAFVIMVVGVLTLLPLARRRPALGGAR